jgi:hypothetical protein
MIFKQILTNKNLFFIRYSSSTIFALATGHQIRSGVAIIRVSGSLATQSLLKLTKETDIEKFKPNKLYLKNIYNDQTKDLIDQCMTVWFKGRHFSIKKKIYFRFLRTKKFHGRRCC